ncbi:cyclin [Colletotrichum truncatum]|uniref:Cyclin n=2 Tax=Colletotrichum truncatum TaxID=5467 RepID=A0ACC3YNS3_COLTU|nr:cyclin [Colletotrichum truncatum]XP_036584584.1 cyclin [Colletotrichum truncatum]KAF6783332.1 cyclin [Colletotrichum truncatum]KAF6794102.1 cyclin [Colletotrichum truncatum]
MHRAARVSCQSCQPWLRSGVDVVVDHYQAVISTPLTSTPTDVDRLEQFCRNPLPLRLVHTTVERFLARTVPVNTDIWDFPSGLEAFVRHLLLWADISGAVFCVGLIYLERAAARGRQETPLTEMGRRLRVLAAIILARKHLEDDTYDTRFWVGVTAGTCSSYFTNDDINDAEARLLNDIIWDLSIDIQEMYVKIKLICDPDTISISGYRRL